MAFWGVEIKPGKPYIHRADERGRLHVSQATLGPGSSTKKTILQCEVGNKKPIYLCSLLPGRLETCALNLEFEEEDEVTFLIVGDQSVHLSGFFYVDNEDQDNMEDDYEYGSDSYEDIVGTESEDEDDYMGYESEYEDESDDYGRPAPNSGVKIEEIVDDENPENENDMSKQAKRQKTQSSMPDDNKNSNRQIVLKAGTGEKTRESNEKASFANGKKLKGKIDAKGQDGEAARENRELKKNKRKAAEKTEIAQENGMPNPDGTEVSPVKPKSSPEDKKEKKKKKKQKGQESVPTPNAEGKLTDKKASEKQEKKDAKLLQVRTLSNGLVIEELAMGKPDGKRASPGKKVSVHYIGKLKKNGKIFDSNIGRAPFKFRLGIGQVIKGWDVGVNGMRIGDKWRLTIPPTMGYGAKGIGQIPPNSWLVFDVELVDVN